MTKHSVFAMCVVAQVAGMQVAALRYIAGSNSGGFINGEETEKGRERLRLCLGYLADIGGTWDLGRMMAGEVRGLAREVLSVGRGEVEASVEGVWTELGDGDGDLGIVMPVD